MSDISKKPRGIGAPDRSFLARIASEVGNIGGWAIDFPSRTLHWSDEICVMLGYAPGHVPSLDDALSLYPAPDLALLQRLLDMSVDQAVPFEQELQIRRLDGRLLDVHCIGKPVLDNQGRVARLEGAFQDITGRRRAEREKSRLARRLTTVFESFTDAFCMLDPDWRFVFINGEASRLLQRRPEDLLGKLVWDEYPMIRGSRVEQEYRQAVRNGAPAHFEHLDPALGSWLEVHAYPSDEGLAVYFRDITRRKRNQAALEEMNRALRQARDEADSANRAKSEFLSRMSHELRTPLNAVLGFAQLLESDLTGSDEPERQEFVGHILHAGQHLLTMIDEILDLARIEAGEIRLREEPVASADIVTEVVRLTDTMARDHGVTVETDIPELPAMLFDRTRLLQVLTNLVSNAIKYGRSDGAWVRISARCDADNVWLVVTDNGQGIPDDRRDQLFQAFNRLGREISGIEGTGIGLTVTRRLVEAMGGSIGFESDAGRGSEFVVTFPCRRAGPVLDAWPATDQPVEPRPERCSVLYIEDEEVNRMLVSKTLQRDGIRLLEESRGEAGVLTARRARPTVVLIDYHLPDMTGLQVAEQLSRIPELADTPRIAITADTTERTRDELRQSGLFDDVLHKPVRPQTLRQTVHAFLVSAKEY